MICGRSTWVSINGLSDINLIACSYKGSVETSLVGWAKEVPKSTKAKEADTFDNPNILPETSHRGFLYNFGEAWPFYKVRWSDVRRWDASDRHHCPWYMANHKRAKRGGLGYQLSWCISNIVEPNWRSYNNFCPTLPPWSSLITWHTPLSFSWDNHDRSAYICTAELVPHSSSALRNHSKLSWPHTRGSSTSNMMDSPKELPKQPSTTCLPTSIISIGELQYLVAANSVASFDRPNIGIISSPSTPLPITIIEVDSSTSITGAWLKGLIEKWLGLDDVFSISFVENVVFQIAHSDKGLLGAAPQVDRDVSEAFSSLEGWSWHFWESNEKLASGPYFLWGSELHQAYRLHPDVCGAFVHGCIPSNEDPLR